MRRDQLSVKRRGPPVRPGWNAKSMAKARAIAKIVKRAKRDRRLRLSGRVLDVASYPASIGHGAIRRQRRGEGGEPEEP
jgi:hypothetical protein